MYVNYFRYIIFLKNFVLSLALKYICFQEGKNQISFTDFYLNSEELCKDLEKGFMCFLQSIKEYDDIFRWIT